VETLDRKVIYSLLLLFFPLALQCNQRLMQVYMVENRASITRFEHENHMN